MVPATDSASKTSARDGWAWSASPSCAWRCPAAHELRPFRRLDPPTSARRAADRRSRSAAARPRTATSTPSGSAIARRPGRPVAPAAARSRTGDDRDRRSAAAGAREVGRCRPTRRSRPRRPRPSALETPVPTGTRRGPAAGQPTGAPRRLAPAGLGRRRGDADAPDRADGRAGSSPRPAQRSTRWRPTRSRSTARSASARHFSRARGRRPEHPPRTRRPSASSGRAARTRGARSSIADARPTA